MADIRSFLGRAVRYGLVGLLNAAVGFGVIAAFDLGLHMRPEIANAAGYAVGLTVSFSLTRVFVFRSRDRVTATGPRYLLVMLTAFALNQIVLRLALSVLGNGALQHALAQASGMAVYTGFAFVCCQLWVFPSRQGAG